MPSYFYRTFKNIRIVIGVEFKSYIHMYQTLHVYFFQANLRACNQDLRNHVSELKQELELQKSALMRVEREKVLISNGKPQWFIIVTLHEGCE